MNAFWSLIMYDLPARLLVSNPLNRYLINSPMLPDLKRDADGGLTLYVQHESPGKDRESNRLPAPNGPFVATIGVYWPKPEALDGRWKEPPMQRIGRRQRDRPGAAGGRMQIGPACAKQAGPIRMLVAGEGFEPSTFGL